MLWRLKSEVLIQIMQIGTIPKVCQEILFVLCVEKDMQWIGPKEITRDFVKKNHSPTEAEKLDVMPDYETTS